MSAVHIIRDKQTGQLKGSVKIRPVWATETFLRRALLMPAIRQAGAVIRYYRDGRKSSEIMRETGYTRPALMEVLVMVRKALGITRDAKHDAGGRRGARNGARNRIPAKHQEFHEGFSVQPAPWSSRGRRYNPVITDAQLQDYFISPAMQRFEIAHAFWIGDQTSEQIATRFGIKKAAVEYQLARIRRVMNNPLAVVHVSHSITKDGLRRVGVTAPYTRKGKA